MTHSLIQFLHTEDLHSGNAYEYMDIYTHFIDLFI